MYYDISYDDILFLKQKFEKIYLFIAPKIYKTESNNGYRINLDSESDADEVYDKLTFELSGCVTPDLDDVTPDGERLEHIIDSL